MAQAKEWRAAYRVALANAAIFLFLALYMFQLEPTSLAMILSAPTLFSLGALLSFLLMVRCGGAFATIAWFVLGSGIFFGVGIVVGGLYPEPGSVHSFSEYILYRDLVRINLLNACSVFIVLAVAYPLANMRGVKAANMRGVKAVRQGMLPANIVRILLKIFPLVVAISAVGVGLKFVLFPVAESLVLRSMVSTLYLIIPFCFLLLGMLWRSIGRHLRLIASCVFFLEILNGLLSFSKFQVISAVLVLLVATWITRQTVKYILMTLIILSAVFIVINPVVEFGRAHIDYDQAKNSVATRLAILSDVGFGSLGIADSDSEESSMVMTRFSVASIQGYLVNEYENGQAGNSLDDFWVALIPRVFWPDKPNVTRFGAGLHAQYQNIADSSSNLAPTYSAEAYWNYGPLGLALVSILLGLEIGWFTRRWQLALAGRDPAFFLIAVPVAIWGSYVETWVAASYVGGFLTFVVIWFVARLVISRQLTA
ncbi:MAG TPA: hypothetical protein VNJ01_01765 [Bacteriovoracaceae bacterium]|nr:hypothetical protein [Bacteriovoracaceae bacterium]